MFASVMNFLSVFILIFCFFIVLFSFFLNYACGSAVSLNCFGDIREWVSAISGWSAAIAASIAAAIAWVGQKKSNEQTDAQIKILYEERQDEILSSLSLAEKLCLEMERELKEFKSRIDQIQRNQEDDMNKKDEKIYFIVKSKIENEFHIKIKSISGYRIGINSHKIIDGYFDSFSRKDFNMPPWSWEGLPHRIGNFVDMKRKGIEEEFAESQINMLERALRNRKYEIIWELNEIGRLLSNLYLELKKRRDGLYFD